MSRRARAIAFLLLALLAAAAAAALANGYGSRIARGYGALRPVVVLSAGLAAGQTIGPREIDQALAVRRVPERFVPPGSLASPAAALGLVTEASLPAGSYLLAGQLEPPRRRGTGTCIEFGAGAGCRERLGEGRRPVEISVSGAGALLAAGAAPAGAKVDVVVTSEPAASGGGRTYVAAAGVPLLSLRPGAEGTGPGSTAAATLGLTRRQALRLIAAESFARKVTVLPGS